MLLISSHDMTSLFSVCNRSGGIFQMASIHFLVWFIPCWILCISAWSFWEIVPIQDLMFSVLLGIYRLHGKFVQQNLRNHSALTNWGCFGWFVQHFLLTGQEMFCFLTLINPSRHTLLVPNRAFTFSLFALVV
jgi:hypothetical protein